MTVANTITINIHKDGQWSIKTQTPHSHEPERSIGGHLTTSRVIHTATEWIKEINNETSDNNNART